MDNQLPLIWSIAAVDNLAAAGVIADTQWAASVAVHCATIVTGVTAQNSNNFYAAEQTKITLLDAQWQALLEQGLPAAIKIGAILSNHQLDWLISRLLELRGMQKGLKIIFDPVMCSSSGKTIAEEPLSKALLLKLISMVDLVTPNIDEAMSISEQHAVKSMSQLSLARSSELTCKTNVLLKGGHLNSGECTDFFINHNTHFPSCSLTSSRRETENTRGTGCALSTLIASYLAIGADLLDAICLAKGKLNQSLADAYMIGDGKGRGYPCQKALQLSDMPVPQLIETQFPDLKGFVSCETMSLGIYPVVDSVNWIEKLLKQGIKTIQLRIKDPKSPTLEDDIKYVIALGKEYDARVFINDYWQLAIKHRAYGVHLGQEDLLTADLQQIAGAGLKLGLSTHGVFESLLIHRLNPSYIALGHVFATQTKDMPSKPQGLKSLKWQVDLFKDNYPLVAIGGISIERASQVAKTGIGSIAVVTAITKANNYASAVNELKTCLNPRDNRS